MESQQLSFHVDRQSFDLNLALRFSSNDEWSAPVDFSSVGRYFVKLHSFPSKNVVLLKVEIVLQSSSIFVVITKEDNWPFRVENESSADIIIRQKSSISSVFLVETKSMVKFAWDDPCSEEHELNLEVYDKQRKINIMEIGPKKPVRYRLHGQVSALALNVIADGPIMVLSIKDYEEGKSIYRPASVESSVVSGSADDFFDVKDVEAIAQSSFKIDFDSVGVSFIDSSLQELLYVSLKSISLNYTIYNIMTSYGISIGWIQIDNQLFQAAEPILLYPAVVKKNSAEDEQKHPLMQLALIRSKEKDYGVDYYKYAALLLQEINIDMDEEVLLSILDFLDISGIFPPDREEELTGEQFYIPKYQSASSMESLMYFEFLQIHPIKLNISFARTEGGKLLSNSTSSSTPISFIAEILTMAIGNVSDAPIKLNALILEDPIISRNLLIQLISAHYSQQVIKQLHKIVGCADVLGNPVGLFNTFSSGVTDLFYEPYNGIVSDRPQDFGLGLAKGGASLLKKTVYGVSDTFSKFTGSVGKGLSIMTFDKEFQEERRREKLKRNRPKHAIGGVTKGAKSLFSSVASGITGIVEKPMTGAMQKGFGGFLKGVGQGIVGAVAKPVVGVFDLASNVSEGIRNTTTIFDSELLGEIDKTRLPRLIPWDGRLRSYSARDSYGQSIMKYCNKGKFFDDSYVTHVQLETDSSSSNLLIVTTNRILNVQASNLKCHWHCPYSNIKSINKSSAEEIIIILQDLDVDSRVIYIPDDETRGTVMEILEKMIKMYRGKHRPLD